MADFIESGDYMSQVSKDAIVTCKRLMSGGNEDLIAGILWNDNYRSFRKQLTDVQLERWNSIVDDQKHSGVSIAYMHTELRDLIKDGE